MLLILCIFYDRDSIAQVIIISPDSVIKVEVKLAEKIHAQDTPGLSGKKGISKKPVLVKDKLTVFFIWKKEGIYRITTRKRPKRFAKHNDLAKAFKFEEIWDADYDKSIIRANKIYMQLGCDTAFIIGGKDSSDDYQYRRVTSFDRNCNLPLVIGPVRNAKWIYFTISVNFFKYSNNEEIEDNVANSYYYKVADSYYYANMGLQLTELEQSKMKIFAPDRYRFYRLSQFIHNLMHYQGMSYVNENTQKFDISFPILVLGRNDLGPNAGSLSNKKENLDYLVKKYNSKILEDGSCTYGYVVKAKATPEYNARGLLIVPGKFILPNYFEIIAVNDIPWKQYKEMLCE